MEKFKLTCMGVHSNDNELQPVSNDVYHAVCATSVRTVFCVHSQSGRISLSFVPRGRQIEYQPFSGVMAGLSLSANVLEIAAPARE